MASCWLHSAEAFILKAECADSIEKRLCSQNLLGFCAENNLGFIAQQILNLYRLAQAEALFQTLGIGNLKKFSRIYSGLKSKRRPSFIFIQDLTAISETR